MNHTCNAQCLANAIDIGNRIENTLSKSRVIIQKKRRFSFFRNRHSADARIYETEGDARGIAHKLRIQLESIRDGLISVLDKDARNSLPVIPVRTAFTRDCNAFALSTPRGHPVIVIDFAFILGLLNVLTCYFHTFPAVGRFVSAHHVDKESLFLNKKFRLLVQSIQHSRDQLWNSKISAKRLLMKESWIYNFGSGELYRKILFFMLAHELSHFVLGHMDDQAVSPLHYIDMPLDYYRQSQAQEQEADIAAIQIYRSYVETLPKFPMITDIAPLILMVYLRIFESSAMDKQLRTHPHPDDRLHYLTGKLQPQDDRSRFLLINFTQLLTIAQEAL
ncbi:MAG: hypothetical protein LWX55_15730 [Deltaproteobacteria bacterium]|jgi:hypothetical protein|nr:hypothetical protein [Deltaproteobacteria bacterium]